MGLVPIGQKIQSFVLVYKPAGAPEILLDGCSGAGWILHPLICYALTYRVMNLWVVSAVIGKRS